MAKKDEAAPAEAVVRIAAAADLHCTKNSVGQLSPLLARMAEGTDILLLCGDLTDFGLPEEKITSIKSSPQKAFPNQCEKVISVR